MYMRSELDDAEPNVVHRRGRPNIVPTLQTSVRRAHVLLRAGIRSGALHRDEQLVETEVVDMLDTSRNAVRKALQMLEREGLVTRGPRNGTNIVRDIVGVPLDRRADGEPAGDDAGDRPVFESELLECRTVRPPTYVRDRLGSGLDGDTLLMGEHLVVRGGEPVSVCVVYTPHELGARCLALSLRDRRDAFVHRYGVDLGRSEETLEAVACEARTSRLLGIDENAPILLRETVSFGADGVARELTYKYNRGDRVSVTTIAAYDTSRAACGRPVAGPEWR